MQYGNTMQTIRVQCNTVYSIIMAQRLWNVNTTIYFIAITFV